MSKIFTVACVQMNSGREICPMWKLPRGWCSCRRAGADFISAENTT